MVSPKKKAPLLLLLAFVSLENFSVELRPPKSKAAQAFPVITVPVMANNQGATAAFFKTRVSIINPTTFSYPIEAALYNQNGFVKEVTLAIVAGQILNYENFLEEVFQYNGAGSVKFDSWIGPEGGSSDYDFLVTAEVYTDSPNGQYKTIVATGPPPDSISQSFAAYSAGIRVDANNRTNIGCSNASQGPNVVFADIYDGNSTLVGVHQLQLSADGWFQEKVFENVSGGYIRWRPSGPAYCYAVVVDNTSNDGTFIPASSYVTE